MVMIQSIDLDPRSVKRIDCRANLNECQLLVATTGFYDDVFDWYGKIYNARY
ncbi:Uncharacterised protein [Citrobacter werkmanii]|uniref:Uncharacterized protein n=1 Tax=Citrobacter werkmanii TaxID=67827 RepID=A0A9N8CTQ6_9ENTR|nr:Uncharacterised protein [Citrobacter werkmanii]CAB5562228.1 Uncharacterised protein [Citrobacter werkmanii]CAB5578001.1 Uncharacterised protein [Citrobacter werkmanii]CAB5582939.1 Uncharacterised protein [Citrobacter werkmanii]CAB5588484.1 Uncharacterised protein [Citrobacter werkmanii]